MLIDLGMTTVLEKRVRTCFIAQNVVVLNRLNVGFGTMKFSDGMMKCKMVEHGVVQDLNVSATSIAFLVVLNEEIPKEQYTNFFRSELGRIKEMAVGFKSIKITILLDKVAFTKEEPTPQEKGLLESMMGKLSSTKKSPVAPLEPPTQPKTAALFNSLDHTSYLYATVYLEKGTIRIGELDSDGEAIPLNQFKLPLYWTKPQFEYRYNWLEMVYSDKNTKYCVSDTVENINTGKIFKVGRVGDFDHADYSRFAALDLPLIE